MDTFDTNTHSMATINGTNGNDPALNGTNGDDIINGLAGDDFLFGGFGNDILNGGRGANRFDFIDPSVEGVDRIVDFSVAQDTIGISAS